MIDINKTLEEMGHRKIVLSRTRLIDKDMTDNDPEWLLLKQQYDKTTDPVGKMVISIWNAILTQRRLVFILDRENVRTLAKDDPNWDKAGLDNNKWALVLKVGFDSGLFKQVIKPEKGQPGIYELTDTASVKYISVDRNTQLSEVADFIKKKHPTFNADKVSDAKTDAVDSSKYTVDSKKEIAVSSQEAVQVTLDAPPSLKEPLKTAVELIDTSRNLKKEDETNTKDVESSEQQHSGPAPRKLITDVAVLKPLLEHCMFPADADKVLKQYYFLGEVSQLRAAVAEALGESSADTVLDNLNRTRFFEPPYKTPVVTIPTKDVSKNKLTAWEEQFLADVPGNLKKYGSLRPKQQSILDELKVKNAEAVEAIINKPGNGHATPESFS